MTNRNPQKNVWLTVALLLLIAGSVFLYTILGGFGLNA